MANKLERIDKVISNMGYGSRKEVKQFIKDGLIIVNGEVVTSNKVKVDPYDDDIQFNGNIVEYRKYIYLMMNKPQDYISATSDYSCGTVVDLLEPMHQIFDPFPVGRLDKDTEGLLLLTNDGKLSHNLLSPNSKVDKVYYAEVDGKVEEEHIEKFKDGVVFLDDDYKTLPAGLEILSAEDGHSETLVTIMEGKYHQVKRMFESIGMNVTYLKRMSMGTLKLDEELELGEYRELTDEELEMLQNLKK